MTEVAAGRVYTATPCTLLVYYTERVTEQLDFLHYSFVVAPWIPRLDDYITPVYYVRNISPYTQMESVSANNCRSVFASSTPTSKETFNRCPEALGVGIRFITMKIEALGSPNEDTR